METLPAAVTAGAEQFKIEFGYDSQGRRFSKKVYEWDPSSNNYQLTTNNLFVYDHWNLIFENTQYPNGSAAEKAYVWGTDLSSSMQGAGGVGGLLMVTLAQSSTYYPSYEGNGNIMGYYAADTGDKVAEFEYGPFGEPIRETGSKVDQFNFRFSTKYEDAETGLLYYGFRYYDPVTGRWPNRDPIEEEGGLNLYGMVGNDPIGRIDVLGNRAYLVYRSLNIDTLRLRDTFPVTGHVYLAFDDEGMGDKWKEVKKATGYKQRAITMSFHPYSVWATANPAAAAQDGVDGYRKENRLSTFITDGSSVLINDRLDIDSFLSGGKTKLVTSDECEQIKLLEVALESALLNNFGMPDPGRYDFARNNCAHWADGMVRRAGLNSPGLGAWNLGVGNFRSPIGAVGAGATFIGRSIYDAVDFVKDLFKRA